MKNYYEILEVPMYASQEEIANQYRLLLQAWHPDKFASPQHKAIAEQKTRDIIEAYNVLKDPFTRRQYDTLLLNQSGTKRPDSAQDSGASSPNNRDRFHQNVADKGWKEEYYCECCGQIAMTRKVVLYENIGMLIARRHRSVKGRLCRNCISYYFWNFTGRTMLLGWWGVISMIVSPLILINNLYHYLASLQLPHPPYEGASPSKFWQLVTVGGFLIIFWALTPIIFFNFDISNNPGYQTDSDNYFTLTPQPATTQAPSSFITLEPTPQPTSTSDPAWLCIPWWQVSPEMEGEEKCVYGTIVSMYSTNESGTRIRFSSKSNVFFLNDKDHIYPDLRIGDCIMALDTVRVSQQTPYMEVENLYQCSKSLMR